MTNEYFYNNNCFFVIKNSLTKEIKVFKNRSEFIDFLRQNIDLNRFNINQLEKNISVLTKEELLYIYLKDWYEIK